MLSRMVGRLGAVLVAVLAIVLVPAAGTASAGANGAWNGNWGTLFEPFGQWGDDADYYLAYGGTCEANYAYAWNLTSGASIVTGNEPWYVHYSRDTQSLQIASGASATTWPSPMISADHARLFIKPSSVKGSKLTITTTALSNEFYNLYAPLLSSTYTITSSGNSAWAPSANIPMPLALGPDGIQNVTFSFSVSGGGSWQIDDLYIDPNRWR